MKTLSTLLVMTLLALAGCDSKTSPEHQAAVESVWDQFMDAKMAGLDEFSRENSDSKIDPWSRARLIEIKAIEDIDVSRCPKDFQKAWANYVTALKLDDPTAALEAFSDDIDDVSFEEALNANKDLREAEKKLSDLFEKHSEKIALEFARQREYEAGRE